MADIVQFPGTENVTSFMHEDEDKTLNSTQVLEAAISANLGPLVIVGRNPDGEFYFASTSTNMGKLLVLLEGAKRIVVDAIET